MKVLLDQNTPANVRRVLKGHVVMTAAQMNWGLLENGHLLAVAEREKFFVMVTCDQSIVKQQNNALRKIALVVIGDTNWGKIRPEAERIRTAVSRASVGSFEFIKIGE